ncbi:MAG: glycosyltransferase family 61 protein [Cyanobacteria bacterium J06600_6]
MTELSWHSLNFAGLNLLVKQQLKRKFIKTVTLDQLNLPEPEVMVALPEVIDTPEALTMPFSQNKRNWRKSTYASLTAKTVVLANVIYVPEYNIVLTPQKQIITDSFTPVKSQNEFKLSYLYGRKIQKISGYCTLIQQLSNNYYHHLNENIPRFYLSCCHPAIAAAKSVKLICGEPIWDNFFLPELIPKRVQPLRLEPGRNYRLEKLCLTTFMTQDGNGHFPQKVRAEIFTRFLPQRPPRPQHHIYISRAKAPLGRHIANEAALLKALTPLKFKKYILEDMPFSQQIELFYDAKIVVAPHGAGLSNLLFGKHLKVLELFSQPTVTPHYYYLAKSMGHEYRYWCSPQHCDPYSNFTVEIEQVQKLLADWLAAKSQTFKLTDYEINSRTTKSDREPK